MRSSGSPAPVSVRKRARRRRRKRRRNLRERKTRREQRGFPERKAEGWEGEEEGSRLLEEEEDREGLRGLPQVWILLVQRWILIQLGLGLGLVYMMSAGKSEILKLNTAVDETATVVKELKTEVYRRKLSGVTGEETDAFAMSVRKESQKTIRNVNDGLLSGHIASCEGECASSVLTDELQEFKMTELEAELESVLQKLPWSTGEASSTADRKMGTDVSNERLHEQADKSLLGLHYSNGVSPHILKHKLMHVLIEQQENQITVLESELQSTRSRLNEKEAELHALKDCVRRLSNISLSARSGARFLFPPLPFLERYYYQTSEIIPTDVNIMSDGGVEARLADEEEEEEEGE